MGNERGNGAALLPIGVFLVIFLGSGIITGDFYAMPAIVAFLIAASGGLYPEQRLKFSRKDQHYIKRCGR